MAKIWLLFLVVSFVHCSRDKQTDFVTRQWEIIGPGGGGSTFTPTFSYSTTDNFLIHCDMTGTYQTHDGGLSFHPFNFKGDAHVYAYDPNDSTILYAAGTLLYKSMDAGQSWKVIFPSKSDIQSEQYYGDHAEFKIFTYERSLYDQETGKIHSVLVDPLHTNTLYLTMGAYFFYSKDAGLTWARHKIRDQIETIYTNTTDLQHEVYLFTRSSIFSFNKITALMKELSLPQGMTPVFSWAAGTIKYKNSSVLYALHHPAKIDPSILFQEDTVWISKDRGERWQQIAASEISHSAPGLRTGFTKILCAEYDASKAYIICDKFEEKTKADAMVNWYGVLKTADTGLTWQWVWKGGGGSGVYGIQDAADATNLQDAWVHDAFGKEFIQIIDAGVAPGDGDQLIITDWYRAMKSKDGGLSWHQVYSVKNIDGTYSSRGLDVTTCYGVHTDPFDHQHLGISYTDIGYHQSFNGGKTWQRAVTGVPPTWTNTCYWMVFDPVVKNKVWSVWSGLHDFPRGKMTRNPLWKSGPLAQGGVCVSEDGGKTWQPKTEGMGMNSAATSIVMDPASSPDHRTLYVSAYNKGVFKSIDGGETWNQKNNGLDSNTCAFELTLAQNGDLFLVTSITPRHRDDKKGMEYYSGAVYKSKDGAKTWAKLHIRDGDLFPNGIAADPSRPGRIYLACWAGVHLADVVGGDVVKSNGGDKMIAMPGGIFLSEDYGDTWRSIFDSTQYVYDVTVDPYHAGRLYCNTFNQAAYRSDDYGMNWKKIKGYDFHWGHRVIVDEADHEKIFLTTYGSSVWHGTPTVE